LLILVAKFSITLGSYVFALISLLIGILGIAQSDSEGSQVIEAAPGQDVIDYILLGAGSTSDITIVPSIMEFGALDPGITYSQHGTLDVKGTGHWIVTVSSDGQPKGHMSEYNPANSQYIGPNGKHLTNSMKIRAVDNAGTLLGQVDLETGGQLLQGTSHSLKSYTIYFDQAITWDDEPLTQNHIYRSVVTFTYT
jgi:hypothetical protein